MVLLGIDWTTGNLADLLGNDAKGPTAYMRTFALPLNSAILVENDEQPC